jgi:hypothetical protein
MLAKCRLEGFRRTDDVLDKRLHPVLNPLKSPDGDADARMGSWVEKSCMRKTKKKPVYRTTLKSVSFQNWKRERDKLETK